MSAKEAEYIAASEAAMEAIWIRKFILGLGTVPTINEPIKMLCDNSAALLIANELGVQKGARHCHRRYHYIRELHRIRQTFTYCALFQQAFAHLFHTNVRTFKYELSQNMNNLEKQLNNEILHEKDSKFALSVIKVQFDKFIHSDVLKHFDPYSSSASYDRAVRKNFNDYTQMEPQTFKETIIQHMNSIEQCIVERESWNGLKRLNERKLQIKECKVQEVKASDAISGDKDCSRIGSDKGNDQGLENQSNTSGDESSRSRNECNDKSTSGDDTDIRPSYDMEPMVEVDSNVIPDSPDMCDNEIQTDQNAVECDDERVALANLIANLKLDIDENKKIQKKLKKENTSLTQELKECKSNLAETSRTLGIDYDKLECKLNETLGLLAQKEIDIKEGLKLKAYEISFVKEKQDELVKQSLLTKSHSEGLVKEKTKIPYDQSDPTNRLVPDKEETLTLEKKSRSKLNKDLVRPYDYTKLNSLYEIFKPATQEYHEQLAHANKVKHSHDHFRAPTALDMKVLIKTCLMPLSIKTQNDSFTFVHELKQEMHADLKHVESLENEIDEHEYDKAEFSNMYDILLQECVSNDVTCSYLHSLSDLDAHTELQCLYVHKVKECECLVQKLLKQTETASKEVYNELL
ncbi:hypothetical protein Tco_0929104 [Tanacetum coccineum]